MPHRPSISAADEAGKCGVSTILSDQCSWKNDNSWELNNNAGVNKMWESINYEYGGLKNLIYSLVIEPIGAAVLYIHMWTHQENQLSNCLKAGGRVRRQAAVVALRATQHYETVIRVFLKTPVTSFRVTGHTFSPVQCSAVVNWCWTRDEPSALIPHNNLATASFLVAFIQNRGLDGELSLSVTSMNHQLWVPPCLCPFIHSRDTWWFCDLTTACCASTSFSTQLYLSVVI